MGRGAMVSVWFVIVRLAFAAGIPRVEIKTVFADLLPQDDEFVKIYNAHPNFGNPLTMFVMLKRKNGDIYHAETLQKVWDLTRNIDLTEGVDHDQIISISTEKLRYVEATPQGVDVRPLMGDAVPKDPAEVEDFRRRVAQSPNARNFYVSADGSSTLISATFQTSVEYGVAFNYVDSLVKAAADENHEVFLAGQPALTGWVFTFQHEMFQIFGDHPCRCWWSRWCCTCGTSLAWSRRSSPASSPRYGASA